MSIEAHQWTNGGDEVLVVRCVNADGTSYGGFENPLEVGAVIEAPDWSIAAECGGGIHGWPWGLGHDGKEPTHPLWLVCGADPHSGVELGGKAKWPRMIVRHVGTLASAMAFTHVGRLRLISASAKQATSGDRSSAATSGYSSSAATSGDSSSAATSGDSSSAATSGYSSSAATSGYRSSAATSGYRSSAATSGYSSSAATSGECSSAATSGECSPAVCSGVNSRAQSGPFGCVALAWWNSRDERCEMRCREVGCGDGSDGKLRSHTWYRLDDAGEFVEV